MKDNYHKKPILVTGAIRSGTTWLGQIIGASPLVAVIHEPFNLKHRIGICAQKWQYQYTYVTDENEQEIFHALKNTLEFRYRPFHQIMAIKNIRNFIGFLRDYPKFLYWRHVSHPRPLIKDPIALFSAEWLAHRFNMDVIILIRHPGSFVWSYKRVKEPNRFNDLFSQKALVKKFLYPFEEEITECINYKYDAIDQAILLWKIVYYVVEKYRQSHLEWIFKKHEDLALNPVEEFRDIFNRISLDYNQVIQKRIQMTTNQANPVEAPGQVLHQLRRNSKQAIQVWRDRLLPQEIDRIRLATEDMAKVYYSDNTWP